jgi:hypothetical protein
MTSSRRGSAHGWKRREREKPMSKLSAIHFFIHLFISDLSASS